MMKGDVIHVAVLGVSLCFSSPARASDVSQRVVGGSP